MRTSRGRRLRVRLGKSGLSLLAAVVVSVSVARAQTVEVDWRALPKDLQLYPRDTTNNLATVVIEGDVTTAGQDAIVLRVYRDDEPLQESTLFLKYSEGRAPFRFTTEIPAELKNYDFEVYAEPGSDGKPLKRIEDVVAGDVLLIQGQSNAMARRREGSASANPENQGPFLRSFGTRPKDDRPEVVELTKNDLNWHLAEGDEWEGPGAVGQWGIRLGRLLVDDYGIPIAIINGARGGETISYFKRNDSDPDDLGTNYGRLLFRAREAGVDDHVRALLWYQGESGQADVASYQNDFDDLYDDWRADYSPIEKVYTFQIRGSAPDKCGKIPEESKFLIRDLQRRIPDLYSDVEVMSTTGVGDYDGCHFFYSDGYEAIAQNVFRQIARDLYDSPDVQSVNPPNIQSAFFSNPSRTEITLRMRDPDDVLVWEAGAEADFVLIGTSETVSSGRVNGNEVVLTLSGAAPGATEVRYIGHS